VNRGAGAPSGVNQQSAGVNRSAGARQNFPGPQINVPGQQARNYATQGDRANYGSRNATANTKRGGDGNRASAAGEPKENTRFARTSKGPSTSGLKRSRRSMVESSDSESTSDSDEEITVNGAAANNANPSEYSRRSVRQKQEVKYKEESDDEYAADDDGNDNDTVESSSFKRLRKGGMSNGDDQSNETKMNEDGTGHNGSANGLNHSVSSNGLDPNLDASDEDKFSCVDPEFFNFDQLRDVSQFKANQIWAVYDSQGCMPRFYARIKTVKMAPKFVVHFVWLEFEPANKAEEAWSNGELPVACGHFKYGDSGTAKETNMFSHTMYCVKSKTASTFEMYPRKGEVWALFKGWDIGWSSDADNHADYEYEVVQVISDFTTSDSIIAVPLVKIKGFVSLFMMGSKETTPKVITRDNTLSFSHCIPHHLMCGTEREGIPEGALELDPAALPSNLEEAFASFVPESSAVKDQEFDSKYTGNDSREGSVRAGERQHATCMSSGIFSKTSKEENREHNTPSAEEGTYFDEESADIVQAEYECPDSEFYEFSEIRLLRKFEPGQIWAIYSDTDKFPNYYAIVNNVDLKNDKVEVRWLDVCPPREEEKRLVKENVPVGCGTFRVSLVYGVMTYTGTDSFSHHVLARSTGRINEYEIISPYIPILLIGWINRNHFVLLFQREYPEHLKPHDNFKNELLNNNNINCIN
jgi:hypothetical protein